MDFINCMKSLINIPIKLHFWLGGRENSIDDDQVYEFVGKIKSIERGIIKFEHIFKHSKDMGIIETYLNMNFIVIWSIDLLSENYDLTKLIVKCPHCKKPLRIDRARG